jgi:hypothetical protein
LAGMFGFNKEVMFDLQPEARAEMEKPPEVKF